ncbi:hypothetical protein [Gordonia neofelifaecis]|uniref:Uncharacterized protein n=1 Tax=Gordonia neofelifaecis NRRL B-59395 TaxID=644548 RepID=F1YMS8_9ACTN|nr:hypothetical protein [Gordonia neofelifaecis]EGD54013.1 hypothetical protein SCNU_16119 [Gordonia neofelifaecis NRRL B-59395]
MVTWNQILYRLLDPPTAPIRGTIVSRTATDGRGPIDEQRVAVWRDGHRMRVEDADGEIRYLSDGITGWSRDRRLQFLSDPITHLGYRGPGAEILTIRSPMDRKRDDFTRPTDSPITIGEYLGRECWNVELAPPPHKPAPMQMVVDTETGATLQWRNDAYGASVSFTEFAVDTHRDVTFFVWDGPCESSGDRSARLREEFEAKRRHDAEWARRNLAPEPITLHLTATVRPDRLRTSHDDESIEAQFSAENGAFHFTLARRTRSIEAWTHPGGTTNARFWATDRFDWAVGSHQELTDQIISDIQSGLLADGDVHPAKFPTSRQ